MVASQLPRSSPAPQGRSAMARLRRLHEHPGAIRAGVQLAVLFLCLWIGLEFMRFMAWGLAPGGAAAVPHPAGAEGFLPISALLSLKYWVLTGRIHPAHPAGLFIFIAILALGLFLKKGFCGWMCPVGSVSEALWRLGRRLFGRNLRLPAALDAPLRAVKYLLLGFFLWAIWNMDGPMLEAFLDSPFNAAADLRMYRFFAHPSGLTLGVLGVLAGLSLVVQNFWCRYLCPYGALLGFLSLASPLRITRTAATCIDCGACARACPSRIQVHQAYRVASDECMACYRCVVACPVKDTLQMRAVGGKAVPAWVFGLLAAGLFMAITGLAMATGHWKSWLGPAEYRRLIPETEAATHP